MQLYNKRENTVKPRDRVQEIAPGVYTGECYAASGEKVYLSMELLTNENGVAWKTYKSFSERFAGAGDTLTASLPSLISAQTEMDGSVYYIFNFKDEEHKNTILTQCGYTEDEFHQFVHLLGKNGFHAKGKREFLLNENDPECGAWYSYHQSLPKYIVYAAKTPDFKISSLTITKKNAFTVKSYAAIYRDLIITVVSDYSIPFYVENRGIFRNPYSVIENSYKGLSMVLHGFSAAVALRFFNAKETLVIRPIHSMRHILEITLSKNDYTVIDSKKNEAITKIKLQALDALYMNGSQQMRLFGTGSKPILSKEQLAKEMGFSL